jgi:hypothetical protein
MASASASVDTFDVAKQFLTTNVYNYTISFSKKSGLLRLNGGLTLASVNNRFENNRLLLLPVANIELAFSSTNSISLTYSSGYEADNDVFMRGLMIDDYRQYTAFEEQHNILHRKDKLQLGVNYFDILNDFTFVASLGCSFTDEPYIFDYHNDGRGVRASLLKADRDRCTQYAYFNIKKGFRIPLVLTFKSTMSNSLYQNSYQHMFSNNRSSTFDGTFALATKFKSLLNIEVGYKLNLQQSKIGISNNHINYAEHVLYVKPMAIRKERFELSLPLSYTLDHSGQNEFRNFDMGLTALFTFKRWALSIEGNNMFQTRDYRRLRIASRNDYNEVVTENRLPGYVIAGIKFFL